jgi:hypothetical protein
MSYSGFGDRLQQALQYCMGCYRDSVTGRAMPAEPVNPDNVHTQKPFIIILLALVLFTGFAYRQQGAKPAAVGPPEVSRAVTEPNVESDRLDDPLQDYQTRDTILRDIPEIGQTKMWFVSRNLGVIGILVEIAGNPVVLRAADGSAEGPIGPEDGVQGKPQFIAKDLDRDGITELIVTGTSGKGMGYWIYHYVPEQRRFQYKGNLSGLKIDMTDGPDGGTQFFTHRRDYNAQATFGTSYTWYRDEFREAQTERVGKP